MPKGQLYPLRVNLTGAELRALALVLDLPFAGDDDDISAVVGEHHNQVAAAKRMRVKVFDAIMLAKEPR